MREIEFRGKSVEDGEWVFGGIHKGIGDDYYIGTDCVSERVETETIGQYTGLRDKKGKKIFEGDIVELSYMPKDFIRRKIVFHEYGWAANIDDQFLHFFSHLKAVIEVIGNIHDNPDLLNGE